MEFEHSVGMKYGAQVQDVEIAVNPGHFGDAGALALIEDFEAAYAARYGAGAGFREAGVEVLRQRVTARGLSPALALGGTSDGAGDPGARDIDAAVKGTRQVYWPELESRRDTVVLDGTRLEPGMSTEGPLIVELPHTTVPVRASQQLRVDEYGSLVIRL